MNPHDRSEVVLSVSGTDRSSLRAHVLLGAAVVFGVGYWAGRRRTLTAASSSGTYRPRARRFTAFDGKKKR